MDRHYKKLLVVTKRRLTHYNPLNADEAPRRKNSSKPTTQGIFQYHVFQNSKRTAKEIWHTKTIEDYFARAQKQR